MSDDRDPPNPAGPGASSASKAARPRAGRRGPPREPEGRREAAPGARPPAPGPQPGARPAAPGHRSCRDRDRGRDRPIRVGATDRVGVGVDRPARAVRIGRQVRNGRGHHDPNRQPPDAHRRSPRWMPAGTMCLSAGGTRGTKPRRRERAWGDDSDAPTPEVALAADLPPDPAADDPDPDDRAAGPTPRSPPARSAASTARSGTRSASSSPPPARSTCSTPATRRYRVGETRRGRDRARPAASAPSRSRRSAAGHPRPAPPRAAPPGQGDHERPRPQPRRATARSLRAARELARELEPADQGLPRRALRSAAARRPSTSRPTTRSTSATSSATSTQQVHLRIELRQTRRARRGEDGRRHRLVRPRAVLHDVAARLRAGLDQDGQGPGPRARPDEGRRASAAGSSAAWSTSRPATPRCARACRSSASASSPPRGEGRVVEVDVLRQRVRVSLRRRATPRSSPATEVKPMFPPRQPQPVATRRATRRRRRDDDRTTPDDCPTDS